MTEEMGIITTQIDRLIDVLKSPIFYLDWTFWNTIILLITLVILLWYTVETHNIAIQTKEANLRPVILRSGFIENWENIHFELVDGVVSGTPLQFRILKNLVTGISGYIILNGYKYTLLFGNEISNIDTNTTRYTPSWGWQDSNTSISAIFSDSIREETQKPNQIIVNYQDIEGTFYHTVENAFWDQKSFKGKHV